LAGFPEAERSFGEGFEPPGDVLLEYEEKTVDWPDLRSPSSAPSGKGPSWSAPLDDKSPLLLEEPPRIEHTEKILPALSGEALEGLKTLAPELLHALRKESPLGWTRACDSYEVSQPIPSPPR
jgi:hypothetical protein